jgi:predicted RNA-binding Zn-ribbon protein involved in translation (DUF1610 family)
LLQGAPVEHTQGCLVCGLELTYARTAMPATCAVCGVGDSSAARCRDGHHVCDACHAGSAKDVIERDCPFYPGPVAA